MLFEIHAEKNANDKKVFYYDNMTNTLKDSDDNTYEFPEINIPEEFLVPYTPFDKEHPLKKSKLITHLKIQMGLSCNYSCEYCSQKFVERPPETSKKDIDAFMEKFSVLEFDEEKGVKIEFWGGEPFVYWKTMKPLAETVWEKFSHWKKKPQFSVITNGSILSDEIIDWLLKYEFTVAISHDGPGQSVRGPDPFDDPKQKELILKLYRKMRELKRPFSFNSMLNSKNKSRKAVYEWFVNLTGDEDIALGEGAIVDAYDEDGITNSLLTKKDHFEFRQTAFSDILSTGGKIGFHSQVEKVNNFTKSVLAHYESKYLGQKCGMDNEHNLAIDMRGNVLTCQNVSALELSKNGESHKIGTLDDYDNISMTTSTHWSNRKDCSNCPVLHICKGACMFLDNKYWDITCNNAYSDNIVFFALGIHAMTGYIPTLIKNDKLPLDRQDIFGTIFEHKEQPMKKVIPIKVVSEKKLEVEGIQVYEKAHVESV